ncbi:type II toxin-antitoxin system VapC family toxin [Planktothrix sp. FACHB-1355]|uniref:Type II toxin-antitoxin system VapC family toxin n=1 Tax=Aerosakkonema funiforme FACHB-1375 TaxID=2949571 RepID=A0A926VDS0_9CYAN|nr:MULTISPECIES: type II toxin-antitoxin system VapC family toxin [Oscillatoriales]MBD2181503.1 type II toxin-antitoxin system VapC family toxin [Aerosakkonema funiforme FACHB-1375]MBD3560552.1 type II toxin-antitoxin system VapC family toxin [Planktothrix sp. FACHB-1355]
MIVLDTHIWVWWIHSDARLTEDHLGWINEYEADGLGISIISCWEVAKLVEYNRLRLPCSIEEWFEQALAYPGICLLDLTWRIALDSTQLPGSFHRDPADQIIVATARSYDCSLLTADEKILNYPHVKTLKKKP